MKTITTTQDLADYCAYAADFDFVTVDTEFLRERTYYSKLCLVQLAVASEDEDSAVLVDPLADGIDLAPLYELFRDESVVKVFHAARQDLEIFWFGGNVIPTPLFDTQVAAMVCGFGDQVGYETLVKRIAKAQIDKSSRFTDWSQRPLSNAQKTYALADVTHLRDIYQFLSAKLEDTGRGSWVTEELSVLKDPKTYEIEPENAWKRVKTRTTSGKFLANVKELAAFREHYAQTKNVPRNRVFKDDAMIEVASAKPTNHGDLNKSRLLLREARKGAIADGILKAIEKASKYPPEKMPKVVNRNDHLQVNPAIADLLRVLLKAKADEYQVAAKLLSSSAELDSLAAGERTASCLTGWRAEVSETQLFVFALAKSGWRLKVRRLFLSNTNAAD